MPVFSLAELEHRAALLLLAMALDWLFGEPEWIWRYLPHPVVLFGKAITFTKRHGNQRRHRGRQRRWFGTIAMACLLGLSAITGAAINAGGPVVVVVVLAILLAGRSLDQHILAVATGIENGLSEARRAIGMIVGRRTDALESAEISRAAIETGAENLSDGVIAPAFWFLIGGLPGLFVYKMTNTADSMIGYRNARFYAFGWAAARFDDVLNYIPARLSGFLIALASIGTKGGFFSALKAIWLDASNHASPNAGWPESAMAGGLGLWLGGPRYYGKRVLQALKMNPNGDMARSADIYRAIRVMRIAYGVFTLLLLFVAARPLAGYSASVRQMFAAFIG